MNNVQVYVARDKKGRFTNFKKQAWKIIKFQLILLSIVMNVFFIRQLYVVTCSAGGHFMSQEKCGELQQNKFDSSELARQERLNEMLTNNQDLMR